MSAAGRAGDGQADWYGQFDEQYNALLHLRGGQQQQQTDTKPAVAPHTPTSAPVPAARPGAPTAAAVIQQSSPLQSRPQSSQSSQRRRSNGGSRRTASELPTHMQQRQQATPVTNNGVPAEFQHMIQQQVDSKQKAALFKKQRAREKVQRKAEEDAKRAEHKAKMKAIQLRAPATASLSTPSSPTATSLSSRPVSRQTMLSSGVERPAISDKVDESASTSSVTASSTHRRPTSSPASDGRTYHQKQARPQSASVAPLPALAPAATSPRKRSTKARDTTPKQTTAQLRSPLAQPPPTDTPSSARSVAAPSSAMASRESLRTLMRSSRQQMQRQHQHQQGAKEPVVEVRVGKPFTPRGSVSGLIRRPSCEFDVVFASAAASLASSPTQTRRATIDDGTAVEWPR